MDKKNRDYHHMLYCQVFPVNKKPKEEESFANNKSPSIHIYAIGTQILILSYSK